MSQRTKSGSNRAGRPVKTLNPKCITPESGCASRGMRWTSVSSLDFPSNALLASASLQLALDLLGVAHPRREPIESLPFLRGAVASSWGICRRAGVTCVFQVIEYSVEPREAVTARNLFSKDDLRFSELNEAVEDGPKVSIVVESGTLPGLREGLAWQAGGPGGEAGSWPARLLESVGPDTCAGEKVANVAANDVLRLDLLDRPSVNFSVRNSSSCAELAQELCREFCEFIVVYLLGCITRPNSRTVGQRAVGHVNVFPLSVALASVDPLLLG